MLLWPCPGLQQTAVESEDAVTLGLLNETRERYLSVPPPVGLGCDMSPPSSGSSRPNRTQDPCHEGRGKLPVSLPF